MEGIDDHIPFSAVPFEVVCSPCPWWSTPSEVAAWEVENAHERLRLWQQLTKTRESIHEDIPSRTN
jgi:hypothetical protein